MGTRLAAAVMASLRALSFMIPATSVVEMLQLQRVHGILFSGLEEIFVEFATAASSSYACELGYAAWRSHIISYENFRTGDRFTMGAFVLTAGYGLAAFVFWHYTKGRKKKGMGCFLHITAVYHFAA